MLPFYSVPSGAVDPEFVSAAGCFSCSSPTAEFIAGSVSTHVLWTRDCSKVTSVVRVHSDTLVQLLWPDGKRIHLSKHVCSRKYQCFPESRANDKTFHEHGLTLMSVNCNCWLWLFRGCLISYEMYPTTPGLLKVMVCMQHKPTLHQSPVQWARQWSHSEGADELLNSPVAQSARTMTAINQVAKQSTRSECTRQECVIGSLQRPQKIISFCFADRYYWRPWVLA